MEQLGRSILLKKPASASDLDNGLLHRRRALGCFRAGTYAESVRKSGVIPYIYDSIVRMSRWFRFCSNETLKFCESHPLGGLGRLLVLMAVHCSTPNFLTLSSRPAFLDWHASNAS